YIGSFPALLSPVEDQLVVDEEFASDDGEEDDVGDDVGGVVGEVELVGHPDGPLLQEHQEEGDQDHHKGVELGQPGHDDGGKAPPAGGVGGDGVAGAGHGNEARQAADGAGDAHGPQVHPAELDAGVAGGVGALSHHGDLI